MYFIVLSISKISLEPCVQFWWGFHHDGILMQLKNWGIQCKWKLSLYFVLVQTNFAWSHHICLIASHMLSFLSIISSPSKHDNIVTYIYRQRCMKWWWLMQNYNVKIFMSWPLNLLNVRTVSKMIHFHFLYYEKYVQIESSLKLDYWKRKFHVAFKCIFLLTPYHSIVRVKSYAHESLKCCDF